jgi:predicted dehydrogenase
MVDRFGVSQTAADYREIAGSVDGVVIAAPPALHYPLAMHFLEQGIPVLCEKPLAESAAEAREMVATSERSGAALLVNQTRRLFPTYGRIRELIAGGVLGELQSLVYHDGVEFNWPAVSAFHFAPGAKGALSDTGIHLLDTVCWWLDARPQLVASRNDSDGGPEAMATVRLRHEACAIEIKVSRLGRLRNRFRIVGSRGSIDAGVEDWNRIIVHSHSGRSQPIRIRPRIESYADFARPLMDNFLGVIRGDAAPLISGASALPAVELLEEAYRCAEPYERPWNESLEVLNVA